MLVVFCAERVGVPLLIRAATALLDVCTNQVFVHATRGWAVGWSCLAAEVLPMLKPRTTFAGVVRCPVNVSDFHLLYPPCFMLAERKAQPERSDRLERRVKRFFIFVFIFYFVAIAVNILLQSASKGIIFPISKSVKSVCKAISSLMSTISIGPTPILHLNKHSRCEA